MAHDFQKESLRRETLHDTRLPCRQNPPFIFAHSPDNLGMLPGGEGGWTFLPRLKCMSLRPGINGIAGDGFNNVQPQLFFAGLRAEGWIVILDDVDVVYYDEGELVEDHGYMGSRPCRSGKVYCSVWDNPVVTGSGKRAKVDWKTKKDREGFDEWKLMLVANGVIPKPTEGGLNELIRRQTRRARRQAGKAGDNKYLQELVSRESGRLDAMLEAKAEMYKSLPKKKRKKLKKEKLNLDE